MYVKVKAVRNADLPADRIARPELSTAGHSQRVDDLLAAGWALDGRSTA